MGKKEFPFPQLERGPSPARGAVCRGGPTTLVGAPCVRRNDWELGRAGPMWSCRYGNGDLFPSSWQQTLGFNPLHSPGVLAGAGMWLGVGHEYISRVLYFCTLIPPSALLYLMAPSSVSDVNERWFLAVNDQKEVLQREQWYLQLVS